MMLLFLFRIPCFACFEEFNEGITKGGCLVNKDKLFVVALALTLVLIFALTGCGDDAPPAADPPPADEEPAEAQPPEQDEEEPEEVVGERIFTLDELATFDGQDGREAYIAVDGVVYDVSNVPQWAESSHFGFAPGIDATEALAAAPHGAGQLDRAVVVGVLAD